MNKKIFLLIGTLSILIAWMEIVKIVMEMELLYQIVQTPHHLDQMYGKGF